MKWIFKILPFEYLASSTKLEYNDIVPYLILLNKKRYEDEFNLGFNARYSISKLYKKTILIKREKIGTMATYTILNYKEKNEKGIIRLFLTPRIWLAVVFIGLLMASFYSMNEIFKHSYENSADFLFIFMPVMFALLLVYTFILLAFKPESYKIRKEVIGFLKKEKVID